MVTRLGLGRLVLALTALVSFPISAEPPRLGEPALFNTAQLPDARGQALLYRLPSLFETVLPAQVRVEYRVEGKLRWVESFDLGQVEARLNAALDLLAYHPDTRAQLARQALEQVVEVSFYLDGVLVEVQELAKLVEAGGPKGQGELHPLAVRSSLRGGLKPANPRDTTPVQSKGFVPDPVCLAQCESAYTTCIASCPDPLSFFCPCNLEREECVAACPLICQEPKSVTPFTRDEYLYSWYGATECRWLSSPSSSGYLFTLKSTQYRRVSGTRTEACNGSFTEQVQSISYVTTHCMQPFYPSNSCQGATGQATSLCY